jgi:hypothetical protein
MLRTCEAPPTARIFSGIATVTQADATWHARGEPYEGITVSAISGAQNVTFRVRVNGDRCSVVTGVVSLVRRETATGMQGR